jgi:hypothetical protein
MEVADVELTPVSRSPWRSHPDWPGIILEEAARQEITRITIPAPVRTIGVDPDTARAYAVGDNMTDGAVGPPPRPAT